MDFFDRMGEKLVTAGRDVTQKAKDLSGTAKLTLTSRQKRILLKSSMHRLESFIMKTTRMKQMVRMDSRCRQSQRHLQQLTI